MMKTPDFQSRQTLHSHAHKSRSAGVSFGRFTERCRTPIRWRGRISNWRASRLRNDAASETMSAVNKCPSGNRRMSDKLQFINLIGIYGRHRQRNPRANQANRSINGFARPSLVTYTGLFSTV